MHEEGGILRAHPLPYEVLERRSWFDVGSAVELEFALTKEGGFGDPTTKRPEDSSGGSPA